MHGDSIRVRAWCLDGGRVVREFVPRKAFGKALAGPSFSYWLLTVVLKED
jgi:hypothetical protein